MVGPVSDEQRDERRRTFKLSLVVLVAFSGGLITLQGGVDLAGFAVATVASALVGVVLVWLVFPTGLSEFR
ncbi:MAG: hypothetical protein ABEI96_05270 [Haloarculaceae archaeon]